MKCGPAIFLLHSCLVSLAKAQPWWPYVRDNSGAVNPKKCARRMGVPPVDSTPCSKRAKTCWFGSQTCPGVGTLPCPAIGTYPDTECFCNGDGTTHGTWSCMSIIPCPLDTQCDPTPAPTPAPTPTLTPAPVQTLGPPPGCDDFVRLDYDIADIEIVNVVGSQIRRIVRTIEGITVTITAEAADSAGAFGSSRLNIYDSDGGSPGNCDADLENLVWDPATMPATTSPATNDIGGLLIIQEDANSCGEGTPGVDYDRPNDHNAGGKITFSFSTPLTIKGRLFIVDQDGLPTAAELFINDVSNGFVGGSQNSEVSIFSIPLSGPLDRVENVNKIEFVMDGGGGIGPLDICTPVL